MTEAVRVPVSVPASAVVGKPIDDPSDAVLTQAVRNGDVSAYGELYARHLGAARRVAASYGVDDAERDDLIAEGFMRVLRILRTGGGPDEDFRPYLLTTIRNTVISWRRRDSPLSVVPEVPDIVPAAGGEDPMGTRMHATLAADAFASLPERWRTVLWRTEIEGESPAQIAKLLGMTPNGVAALAYRAREGLRQAYLDQYVPDREHRTCRSVSAQLAKWVRHGVTTPKARRIAAHLDRCADCREVAADLRRLNQELPATIAPLLLAAPVVLAEWATTASAGVLAATGTGLSWVTAAKTVFAGAAMVTTAAIGVTASAPASSLPPALAEDGGAASHPASQPRSQPRSQSGSQPGSDPGTAPGSAPGSQPGQGPQQPAGASTGPSEGPAPEGSSSAPEGSGPAPGAPGQSSNSGNQQAKQEAKDAKKDEKQEAKDARKDEKQEAKDAKKEDKAAKKSQEPSEPEQPG